MNGICLGGDTGRFHAGDVGWELGGELYSQDVPVKGGGGVECGRSFFFCVASRYVMQIGDRFQID